MEVVAELVTCDTIPDTSDEEDAAAVEAQLATLDPSQNDPTSGPSAVMPTDTVVRAWARREGLQVAQIGRVSVEVKDLYARAHGIGR